MSMLGLHGIRDSRRLSRIVGTLVGVGAAWLGCNQVAGIHEGKRYPNACTTIADCALGTAGCRVATCENEQCVYVDAPDGTRLPDNVQKAGDCVELQCDGVGNGKIVMVSTDVPDDAETCTLDECVGTAPRNSPLSSTTCYSGPAESDLFGNCKKGIQACQNGKAVGLCIGERTPIGETCLTIFDDDCDGSINEEGTGCVCMPGSIGLCYPGQQETLQYGACAAGQQECNATGTAFGPCMGFVAPTSEVCEKAQQDEDCDGRINEDGANCICGDGFISGTEACDDGNLADGDACTSLCKIPGCGDGMKGTTEPCDDGNADNMDACTNQCKDAVCGDGFVEFGIEECDDANLLNTDACSSQCKINLCVLNQVVCNALDPCHIAGTCDPVTGICSNPIGNDGATCNDVDECTVSDECQAGVCKGTNAPAMTPCATCGECNGSGVCGYKILGQTESMGNPSVVGFAIDKNNVYFGNSFAGAAGQASVGYLSKTTGARTFLVQGLTGYPRITAGGAYLYYSLNGLHRVLIAGGTPTMVDTSVNVNAIVTNDLVNVYGSSSTLGTIRSYPIVGGPGTTVVSGEFMIGEFITDGTSLYWERSESSVRTVSIAGGTPTTLVSLTGATESLAVDESNIYWNDKPTQTVKKMPLSGGTSVVLATDLAGPAELTVANGYLYWVNNAGGVKKISTAGGVPQVIKSQNDSSGMIRHDNTCIYWHNLQGTVFSAPL